MPAARIRQLYEVAHQPERCVLGLMSGTSLDGLDLALCRIRGHGPATAVTLAQYRTVNYTRAQREALRDVVSVPHASLEQAAVLHPWLAEVHAQMVLGALREWGVPTGEVDVLASPGQTVYHAPGSWRWREQPRHATLQLGDADHLAHRTGLLTVSDFRQKEIAAGGEGAPLAPYAESLLFALPERPRVLLNVGGIANATVLPPRGSEEPPRFGDTGPGNTLIDRLVRQRFPDIEAGYDVDGRIAARGLVEGSLLDALLAHPYFERDFPKSTGVEMFGQAYLDDALHRADAGDIESDALVATVTRLTAQAVADALHREPRVQPGAQIVVTGGGALNPTLMAHLRELLDDLEFADAAVLGIPPHAKEAVLFAVLANETLAGAGFSVAGGPPVSFGRISFPE